MAKITPRLVRLVCTLLKGRKQKVLANVVNIGLAFEDECKQKGDLAALGGDVRQGEDVDVVPPLANILHGLRGTVCVRGWRYLGRVPLPV